MKTHEKDLEEKWWDEDRWTKDKKLEANRSGSGGGGCTYCRTLYAGVVVEAGADSVWSFSWACDSNHFPSSSSSSYKAQAEESKYLTDM